MCMPFLLDLDPCNLTVPTGWLTTELFVQVMAGIAIAGLLSLLIPENNDHQ